jgi:hypothetical protein
MESKLYRFETYLKYFENSSYSDTFTSELSKNITVFNCFLLNGLDIRPKKEVQQCFAQSRSNNLVAKIIIVGFIAQQNFSFILTESTMRQTSSKRTLEDL